METYKKYNKMNCYDLNEMKKIKGAIVAKEGEDEVVLVPSASEGYFHITDVSRDDFEDRGYDASKLTNADMKYIACKMCDSYVENQFWIDIDYFADYYNLPKIEVDAE